MRFMPSQEKLGFNRRPFVALSKREKSKMHKLPATGFLRLRQILGDPKATPPIPPLIPVSKSTWWAGVKSGRYPKPIKLGKRITAWKVEHILGLIDDQHP